MREKHEIVRKIQAAQKSPDAADRFIEQYLPFIKTETAKFINRIPMEGRDDELSIAMFAFYEAMMAYSAEKGAFLGLAAVAIKNRLIDYTRKESKHKGVISYDLPTDSEDGRTIIDNIADEKDDIHELTARTATKKEIEEFSKNLAEYGLALSDVADNCPKQDRTLEACMKALTYAVDNPEILDRLVDSKKLPLSAIVKGTGAERKTLERHRKYLVAILLAFTNGFEIIRGHLYQLRKKEGNKI